MSVDNTVLGSIVKRLLFTMIKNIEFFGSLDKKPYKFQHYDISDFLLFVNGKQFPNNYLSWACIMKRLQSFNYRTLFEASGIHHSNMGKQITHDMYIKGNFMLLFDFTHDRGEWESHTRHPKNGNMRMELKFNKPVTESITCLLYIKFDNSYPIDFARTVTKVF